MNRPFLFFLSALLLLLEACSQPNKTTAPANFKKGTFGYDLTFLQQRDSLLILKSKDGSSIVLVSPKYQGKVFTSTASGDTGRSFGWINYKAFDSAIDPHMNAYGGEDRLWLGPEGSKFALFFKPGSQMVFSKWHTPAAFDHEKWEVLKSDEQKVELAKNMQLQNYAGTLLNLRLDRKVTLLDRPGIDSALGFSIDSSVKSVGIKTINSITNSGKQGWTTTTGAPCLWNLDMFTPSPGVRVIIPYYESTGGKIATTDYFGQIPPDRVFAEQGELYFKADGKSRGKLGMPANRTKGLAGSYDRINNVLTIITFDVDRKAIYLNQEWTPDKDPLIGDAVNAYNDGPLADGTQMGPFYELESVSPGAFLQPGATLSHGHNIFHFTGTKKNLNKIALKILGVSLDQSL